MEPSHSTSHTKVAKVAPSPSLPYFMDEEQGGCPKSSPIVK